MIRFNIDQEKISGDIEKIVSGLNGIPSTQNVSNMSRAVGSIAAKEFLKSLDTTARSAPRKFHHLYEWNEVGKSNSRLVSAKRVVSGNSIVVDLKFKKSKKKVPIAPRLTEPNETTGKSVTRRSIFKNKAEFMESGQSANWIAKRNVVMLQDDKLIFKRKGTVFNINRPGGNATTGSLDRYAKKWEGGMANSAIDKSRLFQKIETDLAKTLSKTGASSSDIRACIKSVCDKYDAGSREF